MSEVNIEHKIFISYRRDDDPGFAGRIFDRLAGEFGSQHVFMDVDNIEGGQDFVEELERELVDCSVILCVIGREWLQAKDAFGQRRLDNPNDFVRAEIETALGGDALVIPVLVNDATMPSPDDLPSSIRALARRNAVQVNHLRFGSDIAKLINLLSARFRAVEQPSAETDVDSDDDSASEQVSIEAIIEQAEAIGRKLNFVAERAEPCIDRSGMIPGELIDAWRDEVKQACSIYEELQAKVLGRRMSDDRRQRYSSTMAETKAILDRVGRLVNRPM